MVQVHVHSSSHGLTWGWWAQGMWHAISPGSKVLAAHAQPRLACVPAGGTGRLPFTVCSDSMMARNGCLRGL